MTRGNLLMRVKAGYAVAATRGGHGLARVGLLPAVPPPRAHRLRHWAYSLTRVHDSPALAELDVPWWTYAAVDAVEQWLAARPRPRRVFEYGAGASTLWLARRAETIHSVEHDVGFAELLRPLLADLPNAHLMAVEAPASATPRHPSAKEGYAGREFADYVTAIDAVAGPVDLLVIDGRARAACLEHALPRLADDGLVVFDNSRRRRYRPAIAAAVAARGFSERRLRGLTPTLPYPEQTSLLSAARR
jgi:predicted O-methyltransferase YrrM